MESGGLFLLPLLAKELGFGFLRTRDKTLPDLLHPPRNVSSSLPLLLLLQKNSEHALAETRGGGGYKSQLRSNDYFRI